MLVNVMVVRSRPQPQHLQTRVRTFTMSSQRIDLQNINDSDVLPCDSTIGDGSLNITSDLLNETYADVHFQQREYDHGGGQGGQSDVMFNVDPDNHLHANIPTHSKYYSDEQFVRDVKSESDLSFIHFNARSLNKNFQKIKDSIEAFCSSVYSFA